MKYEQLKVAYQEELSEFLKKTIGGKKKQEAYWEALKQYKAEKRDYMKNFRLKKQELLKVLLLLLLLNAVGKIFISNPPNK